MKTLKNPLILIFSIILFNNIIFSKNFNAKIQNTHSLPIQTEQCENNFCKIKDNINITGTNINTEINLIQKVSQVLNYSLKENLPYILVFYSYSCPHCKEFRQFLQNNTIFKNKYKTFEVSRNKKNLDLLNKISSLLNTPPQGVPYIVVWNSDNNKIYHKVYIGFNKLIKKEILQIFQGKSNINNKNSREKQILVPFLGQVKIHKISLLPFTIYIGFLDGLNPCAIWVLVFILGLMLYLKDRRKMIIIGSIYVFTSGFIYFLFMTAWLNIFRIIGYSHITTLVLGLIAIIMGLINLKELIWFKKGISLTIPESAKPKIYKLSRNILLKEGSIWSYILTFLLAVFVNFIELGCTIGLPAIYTRVLTLRKVNETMRILYLILYNVMYIIPLAFILFMFIFLKKHFKLQEKHGKILKAISGLLMLGLGLILLFKPELLV